MRKLQSVKVNPDIGIDVFEAVYTPSEDSRLLLSAIGGVAGLSVLDMGTGTGFIGLHCATEGARVTAVDISETAVENAWHNASVNDLELAIVRSDLFENVDGVFDLIVFNPPYLSGTGGDALSEADRRHLIGGAGGHELTARFLETAGEYLAQKGRVLVLVSSESVSGLAEGFGAYSTVKITEKRLFFEVLAVYELTSR